MDEADRFWELESYSDGDVVARLAKLVGAGHRLTAQVVAHLGEVEGRRLHLDAGYGSMFAYCVGRLGLSEDEACRRIDVARLARRFPCLFPLLANGELTLSVAALLKGSLTESNAAELAASVSQKSVRQAREMLAAHFPRPDVPSTVRKLPARAATRANVGPAQASAAFVTAGAPAVAHSALDEAVRVPASKTAGTQPSGVLVSSAAGIQTGGVATPGMPTEVIPATDLARPHPRPSRPPSETPPPFVLHAPPSSRPIEPLSQERFKVQFTADGELKRKLELTRDLMRHAVPTGDYAAIVGRALDLLIEQLMKSRFGATRRESARAAARGELTANQGMGQPARSSASAGPTKTTQAAQHTTSDNEAADEADTIARAARREVVARDGLSCSWQGPDGQRCGEQAWLELDHVHPKGKGGSSKANNLRLLCKAHNRRAAELAYGRKTIDRAKANKRPRRRQTILRPPN